MLLCGHEEKVWKGRFIAEVDQSSVEEFNIIGTGNNTAWDIDGRCVERHSLGFVHSSETNSRALL